MAYREELMVELEAGRITRRQFSARICRECDDFNALIDRRRAAERQQEIREQPNQ